MRVLGWELPAVGQRPLSRQALITSHLWRFRDDLAVELQPEVSAVVRVDLVVVAAAGLVVAVVVAVSSASAELAVAAPAGGASAAVWGRWSLVAGLDPGWDRKQPSPPR